MSYEWEKNPGDPYSEGVGVGGTAGAGWINVFSGGDSSVADLPTDPSDVEALLRGILGAAGCELSYSTNRTDFGPQGRPGGVRVVKR